MELIALIVVAGLVLVWALIPDHKLYDHRRDANTDLFAHKVSKWFHPEKSELLDRELIGRNLVSTKRARGTDFEKVFRDIGDNTRAEIERITRGQR